MFRSKPVRTTISFTLVILAFVIGPSDLSAGQPPQRWAVARLPTPVLNTPDFRSVYGGSDGSKLCLDKNLLVAELEIVALPGTVFEVHEAIPGRNGVSYLRVTTDEYPFPSKTGYYVDSRFVSLASERPPHRQCRLPSRSGIRFKLRSAIGSLYVWGGNWKEGGPEMFEYYPCSVRLSDPARKTWMLRGVDCSGLIYEASDGYTPRNASALVRFGRSVPIAGLTPEQIASRLEPLDLIVWAEHVMIVLDEQRVIESMTFGDVPGSPGGVRTRDRVECVRSVMKERAPVDEYDEPASGKGARFVVRRWYPTERR